MDGAPGDPSRVGRSDRQWSAGSGRQGRHPVPEVAGRTSGQVRRTGLYYLDDGRNFVVVGTNAGAENDPAWWANLQATPKAEVEVGTATTPVIARAATDDERARLWPRLVAADPPYAEYARTVVGPSRS